MTLRPAPRCSGVRTRLTWTRHAGADRIRMQRVSPPLLSCTLTKTGSRALCRTAASGNSCGGRSDVLRSKRGPPFLYIVFSKLFSSICRSRVTRGSPRERAVAAISLSAGSAERSGGNAIASAAISALISCTTPDVLSTIARTLLWIVPGARMRPWSNWLASSHKLIDATEMLQYSVARRIAASADRDSRLESTASHNQTWVSRRSTSVDFPDFGLDERVLDISDDRHHPLEASDDLALGALHRH